MDILKETKELRDKMYQAVKENDLDTIVDVSKKWDALDNGVSSKALIFEAKVVNQ